jgi:hypothetical protein
MWKKLDPELKVQIMYCVVTGIILALVMLGLTVWS